MTSQPSQSALDAETEAPQLADELRRQIDWFTTAPSIGRATDMASWVCDNAAGLLAELEGRRVLLAEIDRLREALEQARDRMDGSFSHMKPDATDEDRESSAQDLWFGMEEIDAVLQAAGASPSTAEETPE